MRSEVPMAELLVLLRWKLPLVTLSRLQSSFDFRRLRHLHPQDRVDFQSVPPSRRAKE